MSCSSPIQLYSPLLHVCPVSCAPFSSTVFISTIYLHQSCFIVLYHLDILQIQIRYVQVNILYLSTYSVSHSKYGGGPVAVVKVTCLQRRISRFLTSLWPSSWKEKNLPRSLINIQYCGSIRDREVVCSGSVWRAVPSHHPQEVLMAQFGRCVDKGGLKPHSFYFILSHPKWTLTSCHIPDYFKENTRSWTS